MAFPFHVTSKAQFYLPLPNKSPLKSPPPPHAVIPPRGCQTAEATFLKSQPKSKCLVGDNFQFLEHRRHRTRSISSKLADTSRGNSYCQFSIVFSLNFAHWRWVAC